MLSTLCAAVAVGLAAARLTALPRLTRTVAMALVALGLAIDGWTEPVPLVPPPGRLDLTGVPAEAAILELPPDDRLVSRFAMFRALFHRHPLVNGYSGYVPPHYEILSLAIGRDDPSAILELTRGRPLLIVLNEQYDAARNSRGLVEALPGIRRIGGGSGGTMYLLPARPRERVASSGSPISATMTSLPRAHVVLDFGTPRLVRTIELRLGRRHLELGGRVAIEKSFDGVKWDPIWEDWTGGRAMAGALEDPRVVAVRIPLPDISTRYLRMHPVEPWMLTELRLWGP